MVQKFSKLWNKHLMNLLDLFNTQSKSSISTSKRPDGGHHVEDGSDPFDNGPDLAPFFLPFREDSSCVFWFLLCQSRSTWNNEFIVLLTGLLLQGRNINKKPVPIEQAIPTTRTKRNWGWMKMKSEYGYG